MEHPDPARKLSANLYDIRIPLLCVQWKTPDDGQRNCPKHGEFHSKNKFEKLVHLVGFIIRNLTRRTVTRETAQVCVRVLHIKDRWHTWLPHETNQPCKVLRKQDKKTVGLQASHKRHFIKVLYNCQNL